MIILFLDKAKVDMPQGGIAICNTALMLYNIQRELLQFSTLTFAIKLELCKSNLHFMQCQPSNWAYFV
jgi:hypothetical protein